MMPKKEQPSSHPETRGLTILSFCLLAALSLMSFHTQNVSSNWLGVIGHAIAWSLTYLFGIGVWGVVAFLSWMGWKLLVKGSFPGGGAKAFYFFLCLISFSILLNVAAEKGAPIPGALKHKILTESIDIALPYPHHTVRRNLGGVPFYYLYRDLPLFNLQRMLSDVGVVITFLLMGNISFLFMTEVKIVPLIRSLLEKKRQEGPAPEEERTPERIERLLSRPASDASAGASDRPPLRIRTLHEQEEKGKLALKTALSVPKAYGGDYTSYQIPPPSLLSAAKKVDQPSLKKELRRQAEILEETLLSFGIEAKVGDINCGPTITSFEVHPSVGVKVQKITALENDIALNLQAKSIRIIAPIPGKAAVGVEVPSPYPQEVGFKEMLTGYQESPRKALIPILLGKTVTGENVISDLAKMPHCLIAGATGSGKSVCINTIVMSILMNARPDEIKLLMVDPKKVELTAYTRLPHMIAPVITEAHGAYAALQWLVKEMQLRYDILKQLGLRNIAAFNTRTVNKELESSLSVAIPERMHAIVAIIDEFADLMMASSSDLETPIARIAQMARAVGIHLILATQRPSREVITGLIKANFPTRIAFKVSSRVNSQIIIDDNGADSLLGNGDMLFLPPGSSHLIRAQGAYISDEDLNRVISFISDQAGASYLIPSFDNMPREEGSDEISDPSSRDLLYDQARQIVIETRNASTTFLQRKLKIGYARAASLMDELEAGGVIGPQEGAKPRRILVEESERDREGED